MPLTSTVPAALGQLYTYLQTVVAASSVAPLAAYYGAPVANVTNNYVMVGHWENGQLLQNYQQDFAGFPAIANKKNEQYELLVTIRTWDGSTDPTQRVTDLMSLADGVMSQFANDPNASGTITPSGTWSVGEFEIVASGPFGGKGFGVLAQMTIPVINVRLVS